MFGRAAIKLGIGPHSSYSRNYEVGSMDVGAGLYICTMSSYKNFTFAISSPDEFLFDGDW